jgi:protein phosphatase 4 regulatory subunit 3
MTRHEKEIQELAKSPLGAERFQSFIQRWERNNEPPPPPDALPIEKFVSSFSDDEDDIDDDSRSSAAVDVRSWPSERALDAEEEDYFNTDDDEDNPVIPSISQQFSRGNANGQMQSNMLKRKRRVALGNATKGYRPQNHTPIRSPSLGQLVDYGDEEEEESSTSEPDAGMQATASMLKPKGARQVVPAPSSSGPVLPKRAREEDEEDEWMDRIAQAGSRPESPSPGMMVSDDSLGPSRPEKRRKTDDDDDGTLGRLAKRPAQESQLKKPQLRASSDSSTTKTSEDPPVKKKFKVKLGPTITPLVPSPIQTPVPFPSENGTKDGDTG